MARQGSCENADIVNRGAWSAEEDKILINYVQLHGEGNWTRLSKRAGLKRSGKSSRLRWLNYLKPDIKRGNISLDEEDLIIRLHNLLGNRWSLIAGRLPGRTDNEIKNYWNTHLRKKREKQNHDKTPLDSNEIPRKSRVEPKGCTTNSLDINNTTKSPNNATNYDSVNTMDNEVISTCLDNHNHKPFACTPQDSHDNFSTLEICDKHIIPYENCHYCNGRSSVEIPEDFGDEAWWLDDSIGQAWHESWKLIDFFPPDQVANLFSF